MAKETFSIVEMHCPNCVMTLLDLEEMVPGVFSVDANYHRQSMVVEYDEALLTVPEIIEAIKQLGYTAVISSK